MHTPSTPGGNYDNSTKLVGTRCLEANGDLWSETSRYQENVVDLCPSSKKTKNKKKNIYKIFFRASHE